MYVCVCVCVEALYELVNEKLIAFFEPRQG